MGITYPDSSRVSFSYDANGNRTKMIDPRGTTTYSYDSLDRLTSVARDVYSIGYEYDLASNITEITYPDGLNVSYTYNELNNIQSVSDAVYTATFTYDELGNIIGEELPNGVTVSYQYDDSGRLVSLQHVKSDTVLTGVEYTLDNVGNRLSVTDENGRTTRYTYDNLNQLTGVEYPDAGSVTYTYDPVGNRLRAGEINYTYDSANQLVQVDGTPYEYDANGNLLSVGESVYYKYDHEDRLVSLNDGTNTHRYTYDGDGNRLAQTVSGAVYGEYSYIYDINAGLPLLLVEKDSQGNANNYIYAGGLYGRTGPEGRLFYHADGLGSVSVVSDVYGEPLNRYTYDAFGNPQPVSESVYNPFMFTGEPYDPSGLIFLRARYYDPSTGRFLTPDTLMGQLDDPLSQNLYVYCGNNPVVYIDPSGQAKICTASTGDEHNYLDDAVVITSFGSGFKGAGNSKGLGNPFKGKTFKEIENMFLKKGFEKRGPDPLSGRGGYVNPKTERSYYLDKGGHYKKGYEPPHVDVNRLNNSKNNLPKKKYFLK